MKGKLATFHYRMQWLAHTSSRLTIYYGSLKSQHRRSLSLFSCLGDSGADVRFQESKRIIIVGLKDSEHAFSYSHKILQQLMCIIPISAILHHNLSTCTPVLPGYQLHKTEPSPSVSKSYKISPDPGIRIESHSHLPALKYSRVGDDRLCFVQFDYREGQFIFKQEIYSEVLLQLFDKVRHSSNCICMQELC